MGETGGRPRLGDLFSGWDELSLSTRRLLAGLLLVPGRPPHLLPGELASALLPRRAEDVCSLRELVVAGLGPEVLAPLARRRLVDVVPAVGGCQADIASPPFPARLRAVLDREQVVTWAQLGQATVAQIQGWAGVGPGSVVALMTHAIELGMAGLGERTPGWPEEDADVAGASGTALDALALLLDYERDNGIDELRPCLARFLGDHHPEALRTAAARLLALPAELPGPLLGSLTTVLEAAGGERDRLIFERLSLVHREDVTPTEVAAALEITVERVRQMRARIEDRVRAKARQLPDVVQREVDALAGRLGAAVPLSSVDDILVSSGLPGLGDTRSLLLVWLAGPYRRVGGHEGWIATDPNELRTETRRMLGEDGGVRLVDQVAKELAVLGLAPELVEHWLVRQPVRQVGDLLVDTRGAPADVAERALSALGRSMTVDELSGWCGAGARDRPDRDMWPVLSRDDRFVRVSADGFELAEWGGDRYDELSGLFAPTSGATVGTEETAPTWLRVVVDAALLAGGEAGVPVALVRQLALRVGGQRTFATRYGPVTLSHDPQGPTRSSLRHIALAAGSMIGDELLVGFASGVSDAVVERVPKPVSTPGPVENQRGDGV